MECRNYVSVDTIVLLSKNVCLNVRRDPDVFGNVRFKLWNPDTEQTSANTEVDIDGHPVKSDVNGNVSLIIPLAEQKTSYPVSSSTVSLADKTISLPCGPDDVIIFE